MSSGKYAASPLLPRCPARSGRLSRHATRGHSGADKQSQQLTCTPVTRCDGCGSGAEDPELFSTIGHPEDRPLSQARTGHFKREAVISVWSLDIMAFMFAPRGDVPSCRPCYHCAFVPASWTAHPCDTRGPSAQAEVARRNVSLLISWRWCVCVCVSSCTLFCAAHRLQADFRLSSRAVSPCAARL